MQDRERGVVWEETIIFMPPVRLGPGRSIATRALQALPRPRRRRPR